MSRKANNRIQLLCELKMMKSDWSAWTEDSYASTMYNLDDDEIIEFMQKTESEISDIQLQINTFYQQKVI